MTICITSAMFINAQTPIVEWAKSIGGVYDEMAFSIALDSPGNVYTIGYYQGTVDFDPGVGIFNLTGIENIFISKLDATGNFIWAKSIDGTFSNNGVSITIDGLGNIYTTGYFAGTADFDPGSGTYNLTSVGSYDIFILKLNSSGNFVWAKNMGGTTDDKGLSISVDMSGNVYTTGSFTGTADFNPGTGVYNLTYVSYNDIFISKLDASGNFVWAKKIGGVSYDSGYSIALDTSGNVYTTGIFSGTVDFDPGAGTFNLNSNGDNDVFISKLDGAGNFIWAKKIGGSSNDEGNSVKVDIFGNAYITGDFNGTVDFNPGTGVFNLNSTGTGDAFILKLDVLGNFLWAKNMGGTLFTWGRSIDINSLGNVFTIGCFYETVDFNPDAGILNLTSAGSTDIFISKLSTSGSLMWAKRIGGGLNDQGLSIKVDALDNIYTTGYFYETVDFDPDTGTFNLASSGSRDIFVHKMSQTATGINENENWSSGISIYPNPTTSSFNVTIPASQTSFIEIYNSLGALVHQQTTATEQNTINLSNQPNGLYFVKVINENGVIGMQKIIKH